MHRVAENVRITYGHDGAMLLDIRRDRVLRFNLTGSMILQRLQQRQTIAEITDAVSQRFSIPRDVAEADVGDFVKSMEREGLVQTITFEETQ